MVEMLNKLYVLFDDITDMYKVYKVVHALLLPLFVTARRYTLLSILRVVFLLRICTVYNKFILDVTLAYFHLSSSRISNGLWPFVQSFAIVSCNCKFS